MSIYEVIAAVQIAMQENGIETNYEPKATGDIERFKIRGKSGKCGWVVIDGSGKFPHAAFGDWSTSFTGKWTSFNESKLNIDEHKQYLKEVRENEKKRREAERKFQDEKRKEVEVIVSNLKDAKTHEYATKKKISLGGMKYAESMDLVSSEGNPYQLKECLVIPYTNVQGRIMTMQIISGKSKIFFGGAPKKGSMVLMGDNSLDKIIVGEGFSTVRTVYDALGGFCVAAGDCGNLLPVCEELRKQYPSKEIIIIADNDQYKDKNVGVDAAKNVAEKVKNVRIVIPVFKDKENQPTDFNDLLVEFGEDELMNQLGEADLLAGIEDFEVNGSYIDDSIFITPLPDMGTGSNPKPKSTIENFIVMMQRLKINIRYNVIKKESEIIIPYESYSSDNAQNASLARILSRCAQFNFPTAQVNEFIGYIAENNKYNPVIDWIESDAWDGVDRLSDLIKTIKPKEFIKLDNGDYLHESFIKRWMVQAIASAYSQDGLAGGGVLVLQGDQNLGKTTWLRRLVGDQRDLFKDGVVLRLDKKDDVKQAVSYWIVELGELDGTFNKSEASALKAFLTNDKDELRQAYARKANNFARRTVFCASVNPEQFLKDPTGNRRYWTVACESIDNEAVINMQQVWAQVHQLWLSGYKPFLESCEYDAMMGNNEKFAESNPITELVQTKLNWSANVKDWRWVTATEVLLELDLLKPTQAELKVASASIKKLNEEKSKRSNGKNLLYVPPLMDALDRSYSKLRAL